MKQHWPWALAIVLVVAAAMVWSAIAGYKAGRRDGIDEIERYACENGHAHIYEGIVLWNPPCKRDFSKYVCR